MSAVMQWPPVVTGLSMPTLRRLQGVVDVELEKALSIRAKASSALELLAAHEVVDYYRAILAACRRARAAHARATGWGRAYPRRPAPEGMTPPAPATAATPAVAGVAGAEPLPWMGQGRPASPCAGSADAGRTRSENAPPVGHEADAHPAQPAFFGPSEERISTENNAVGGIPYAQ